jgi:chemotaxis protein methyltransferase CheR
MAISGGDWEVLRLLVRERSGILLEEGDRARVESRLAPVAKAEGLASLSQLVARLRPGGWTALHAQVIEALLALSPPFLLEPRIADELSTRIIPELMRRRAVEKRLRFWCPLCGGAQAPASLAVLLSERFPELESWDVGILATDRSFSSLADAERGRFTPVEVAQGIPTRMLVRRFRRQHGSWQLDAALGRRIRFAALDVRGDCPEPTPMDLIVVRRVLVYLAHADRLEFIARLRAALAPDGFLFLDSRDAATLEQGFMPDRMAGTGFYRVI